MDFNVIYIILTFFFIVYFYNNKKIKALFVGFPPFQKLHQQFFLMNMQLQLHGKQGSRWWLRMWRLLRHRKKKLGSRSNIPLFVILISISGNPRLVINTWKFLSFNLNLLFFFFEFPVSILRRRQSYPKHGGILNVGISLGEKNTLNN